MKLKIALSKPVEIRLTGQPIDIQIILSELMLHYEIRTRPQGSNKNILTIELLKTKGMKNE